jgi:TPR repeat protein
MMKLIQAGLVAVVMSLGSMSAWAEQKEDYDKANSYFNVKNYAEAALWFRKAAEQGNAVAQKNLGDLYGIGRGVPQDYITALMWYNLAEAAGYIAKNRDLLAKKMNPTDISEAQRRAKVCLNSNYQNCY